MNVHTVNYQSNRAKIKYRIKMTTMLINLLMTIFARLILGIVIISETFKRLIKRK